MEKIGRIGRPRVKSSQNVRGSAILGRLHPVCQVVDEENSTAKAAKRAKGNKNRSESSDEELGVLGVLARYDLNDGLAEAAPLDSGFGG